MTTLCDRRKKKGTRNILERILIESEGNMKAKVESMSTISHLQPSGLLLVLCLLGSGCSSESPIPPAWGNAELSEAALESQIKEGARLKDFRWSMTETGGESGYEQNGAAVQQSAARTYEGTATGENGHMYKVKATYIYSQSDGRGTHDFHWDVDDSQGDRKSGTYKGP